MEIEDDRPEFRSGIEDFLLWSKNIPYLYDDLLIQTLPWSCSSLKFLNSNSGDKRLLLGTKSQFINSSNDSNTSSFMILELNTDSAEVNSDCNSKQINANQGNKRVKVLKNNPLSQTENINYSIRTYFNRSTDENSIFAMLGSKKFVFSKEQNNQFSNSIIIDLEANDIPAGKQDQPECFGIDYQLNKNIVAASSYQGRIKLVDMNLVEVSSVNDKTIGRELSKSLAQGSGLLGTIDCHRKAINDLKWSKHIPDLLFSCSNDRTINLYSFN